LRSTLAAFVLVVLFCSRAAAQEGGDPEPSIPENRLPAGESGRDGGSTELDPAIRIVLVLTVLALAPAILMTVTSFTRILIVLSFVRRAVSVQELPPNQVLIGLSLFLTILIMEPVISDIWKEGVKPYTDRDATLSEAAERSSRILSKFLLKHTREQEIALFIDLTGAERPEKPEDVPLQVIVPAFAISELKTAFQMGFLVFLPFLIVDLVVSSILLSMGMFMLPPIIISTPFKILLFVLVNGWELVIRSLVMSFNP
jgi:flagellar biosynthetic protein FliP